MKSRPVGFVGRLVWNHRDAFPSQCGGANGTTAEPGTEEHATFVLFQGALGARFAREG